MLTFYKPRTAEKAIKILTEVLQKDNQMAYAFNNRALAYIKTGRLKIEFCF
jgi:lipoprotein NlpI